jgi:hypothetical protein
MKQNEERKVTKITEETVENRIEPKSVSPEQLQHEFDYIQAERLLKKMLEKDLITEIEFNEITVLNRQTFSPFLAEIMP